MLECAMGTSGELAISADPHIADLCYLALGGDMPRGSIPVVNGGHATANNVARPHRFHEEGL
jgi:hypothetical protein